MLAHPGPGPGPGPGHTDVEMFETVHTIQKYLQTIFVYSRHQTSDAIVSLGCIHIYTFTSLSVSRVCIYTHVLTSLTLKSFLISSLCTREHFLGRVDGCMY